MKLLIVVLGAVALATPSAAEPAFVEATIPASAVDFRDAAATAQFYATLRATAAAVCDTYAAHSRVTREDASCAARAVADVVRRLDKPMLTAVHAESRGGVSRRS